MKHQLRIFNFTCSFYFSWLCCCFYINFHLSGLTSLLSMGRIATSVKVSQLADWLLRRQSVCSISTFSRYQLWIVVTSPESLTQQSIERHWSVSGIDWLRFTRKEGSLAGREGGVWWCEQSVLVMMLWSWAENHFSLVGKLPVHFDSLLDPGLWPVSGTELRLETSSSTKATMEWKHNDFMRGF